MAVIFYVTHYCLRPTTLTFNRSVSLKPGRSRKVYIYNNKKPVMTNAQYAMEL